MPPNNKAVVFKAVAGFVAMLILGTPGALDARMRKTPKQPGREESRKVSEEKTGSLPTHDGLRLRLATDFGNVRILTQNSGQVSYRIRLESDAREPDAQDLLKQYQVSARNTATGVQLTAEVPWHKYRGRLTVNFEVNVPRNYHLDVLTQAGSIETQDIDGRVSLVTSGGNITAGRVGGRDSGARPASVSGNTAARLETQGGHISVQDVNGDLRAITAGGHITAANVQGNAVLRTGGGHIRAGTIQGTAQLDTGGGNISVRRAGSSVNATTGGGQIDFGEAAGSVKARTGGGGIRVLRVVGPMQLESGGGSIFLTKVQGAVHASTGAGSITAWFTPGNMGDRPGNSKMRKLSGASQLESGQGDIVVYLPRELAVTIEAIIETAVDHRIEADPSLPLKLSYPSAGGQVRGELMMNGGGEVLRLKTMAGNIRLKLSEPDLEMRLQQEMEKLRRHMELQQQRQLERQHQREERHQSHVEHELEWVQQQPKLEERECGPLEGLQRKLEAAWLGGVRVDADAQKQKLLRLVQPNYPDVARQAGVEGTVRLKAVIGRDGTIQGLKAVEGEPVLVNAAMDAIRQWRYQPTLIDGKPVNVVTTVTVEFRLK